MSEWGEEGSTLNTVVKWLTKLNHDLKSNLEEYQLEKLYGFFMNTFFILTASISILSSRYLTIGFNITYYAIILVLFLFISPVIMAIFCYVIVPLYGQSYDDPEIIKSLLAFQAVNLIIGVFMFFIYKIDYMIISSYFVFIILAFIHPVSKYLLQDKIIKDIKNSINKTYGIITVIYFIVTIILKFSNMFTGFT